MKFRNEALLILMVIAAFGISALFYNQMPDPTPTHWNARGVVDGWTPKPWGPFITPLIMLGMYFLFLILPAVSPKGFQMEGFIRVYNILRVVILGLMLAIQGVVVLAASGQPLSIQRLIPLIIGLSIMILGNYMGKVTRNFFVGIRTPWTLASDEVWNRTHRLGGRLFAAAGLLMALGGLIDWGILFSLGPLIAVSIYLVVYSYVIYKRLEGFSEKPSP